MVLKAHPSDVSNAAVNISINLSEETGYLYPPILDSRAIVHLWPSIIETVASSISCPSIAAKTRFMVMNTKDLRIFSPAFAPLERIPQHYTSDGDNRSPALEWSGLSPETQQLAIICHDPDAPFPRGFAHWLIYNIPPTVNQIAEASGSKFTEGINSENQPGYTGPAPPLGHGLHHYYFWIYALDTDLDLTPDLNREQLLDKIENHVIEQARLVGVYER